MAELLATAAGVEAGRSGSLHQLKKFIQQAASGPDAPKDLSLLWEALKGSSPVTRRLACDGVLALVKRGRLSLTDATHRLVDFIPTVAPTCLEDALSTLLQILQLYTQAAQQQQQRQQQKQRQQQAKQQQICPFTARTHPLTLIAINRPEVCAPLFLQMELLLVAATDADQLHMFAPFFKFIFSSTLNYNERANARTELFHLLLRLASSNRSLCESLVTLVLAALPTLLNDTPAAASQRLALLSTCLASGPFATALAATPAAGHTLLACGSELLLGSTTRAGSELLVPDAALMLMADVVHRFPQHTSLALHAAVCAIAYIFTQPATPAFHRLAALVAPALQAGHPDFADALQLAVIHAAVSEGVRDDLLVRLDTLTAPRHLSSSSSLAPTAIASSAAHLALLADHMRGREAVYLLALEALFAARAAGPNALVELLSRHEESLNCTVPTTTPEAAGALLLVTVLCLGQSPSEQVQTTALSLLAALVAAVPAVGLHALTHVLYRLKHASEPTAMLRLVTFLPSLCVDKSCLSAVMGTLVALSQAPRMIALSLRGLYAVWLVDRRAWPHLQQVLLDKARIHHDLVDEVQLARAYYMKQVFYEHPDLGKDFLGVLREFITSRASGPVVALATDALLTLCESGVLDTDNVWAVIRAPLLSDSRPVVLAGALAFAARLAPTHDAVAGDATMHADDFVADSKRKELLALLWSFAHSSAPLVAAAALDALAGFHPSALLYSAVPSVADPALMLPVTTPCPPATYIQLLASARLPTDESMVQFVQRRLHWEMEMVSRSQRQQWAHGKFPDASVTAFDGIRTFVTDQYSHSPQPAVHAGLAFALLFVEEEFVSLKPASAQRAMVRRLKDLLGETGVLFHDWWLADLAARGWEALMVSCFRVFHRAQLDSSSSSSISSAETKVASAADEHGLKAGKEVVKSSKTAAHSADKSKAAGKDTSASKAAAALSAAGKAAAALSAAGKAAAALSAAGKASRSSTLGPSAATSTAAAVSESPAVLARDQIVEELGKGLGDGEPVSQANSIRALAALATAGGAGISEAFGPAWVERVLDTLLAIVSGSLTGLGTAAAKSVTASTASRPAPTLIWALPSLTAEPVVAAAALGLTRVAVSLAERGSTVDTTVLVGPLLALVTTQYTDGRTTLHLSCLRSLAQLMRLLGDATTLELLATAMHALLARPSLPSATAIAAGRVLGAILEQLFNHQQHELFARLWIVSWKHILVAAAAGGPAAQLTALIEGHTVAVAVALPHALAEQAATAADAASYLDALVARVSQADCSFSAASSLETLVDAVTRLGASAATATILDDTHQPYSLVYLQSSLASGTASPDQSRRLTAVAAVLCALRSTSIKAPIDAAVWPVLKRSLAGATAPIAAAIGAVLGLVMSQDSSHTATPQSYSYLPDETSLLRVLFDFLRAGCPGATDATAATAAVLTAMADLDYLPPVDWSGWLLAITIAQPASAGACLAFALALLSQQSSLGAYLRWCCEPVHFQALPLAAQQQLLESLANVCLAVGDLSLASFVSACGPQVLQLQDSSENGASDVRVDAQQGSASLRTAAMRGYHGCLKHCGTHHRVVASIQTSLLDFHGTLDTPHLLAADMLSPRAAPFHLFTQCVSYLPLQDLQALVAVHDGLSPLAVLKSAVVLSRTVRFSSSPVAWLEPALRWLLCVPHRLSASAKGDDADGTALLCYIAVQLASSFLPLARQASSSSTTTATTVAPANSANPVANTAASTAAVQKQVLDLLEMVRSYINTNAFVNTRLCLYLLTSVFGAITNPAHFPSLSPVPGPSAPVFASPLTLSAALTVAPFHVSQILDHFTIAAPKIVQFFVLLHSAHPDPTLQRIFLSIRHHPAVVSTEFWTLFAN